MQTAQYIQAEGSLKFQLYHRENQQWLSSLVFFKEEIQYFDSWLERLQALNLSKVLQDEWIVLEERLGQQRLETLELLKAIEHEEFLFGLESQQKDFQLGEEHFLKHRNFRIRYHALERDFLTTKHDFYEFMTHIMD
ncbi:hypothetical protein [Flectobacillus major]|jgi:hypothetical protein|uniref:hypothetical protein n=1 Tax=Flectobacillus major TaxID=103 RepID=UPI00041F3DC6|nr:hypothetical protein [Flectobacillus major]